MIGFGERKRSKKNMHERNIRSHIFKVAKKTDNMKNFWKLKRKT